MEFEYTPERSSWVALRVFPAAHTNPIFVEVDGAPIRASKRSAQWCLDAVDRCWESKSPLIRESEREAARAAYDHARATYRQILAEGAYGRSIAATYRFCRSRCRRSNSSCSDCFDSGSETTYCRSYSTA